MTSAIFKKLYLNFEKSDFESCENIKSKPRFQCFSLSSSQHIFNLNSMDIFYPSESPAILVIKKIKNTCS